MDENFARLEKLLYGFNYQVFLRRYPLNYQSNLSPEAYILNALGPTIAIEGIVPATTEEVMTEFGQSLRYRGDEGSGPIPSVLASAEFEDLVAEVETDLRNDVANAALIARFWLSDGHPAYPVFWDFAFLIAAPRIAFVLIGCSSD